MTSRPKYSCILLLVVLLLSSACTRHYDARLEALNSAADTAPDSALAVLVRIDTLTLSERDANYHRFLGIKLRDKAYISHSSDTTILRVLDYSYSHDKDLYPEALYYGGRVYSDLGDYPTALRYFQDALDLLPEETANLKLRGNVLSQTARLLNELRLYSQAAEYLAQTIEIDSILNDSINLMFDEQLLGAVLMHAEIYDKALNQNLKARKLAQDLMLNDTIAQDIYTANILFELGDTIESFKILKNVTKTSDDEFLPLVYSYAAELYYCAEEYDSVYVYANKLLALNNQRYLKIAYKNLLRPHVVDKLSTQQILDYNLEYHVVLEHYLNQHEDDEILIQNAMYNYRLHEKKRFESEAAKNKYMQWLTWALIIIAALVITILYQQYKKKKTALQLHKALYNIEELKKSISQQYEQPAPIDIDETQPSNKINDLREKLKNELLTLQQQGQTVPPVLLDPNSDLYEALQEKIKQQKTLPENNALWHELEKYVLQHSPKFKYNLDLLTEGKLKQIDYHCALLNKCGISPTNIAHLIALSKGAVSYRRNSLCQKIFGVSLGAKVMDDIILSL